VNGLTNPNEITGSFSYLASLILVYGALVGWWIYHNVRIYRKKGPRRSIREVPFQATHDLLQRQISLKADLEHGREIHVRVAGNEKLFIDSSLDIEPPSGNTTGQAGQK
jgi:hypothetical protein